MLIHTVTISIVLLAVITNTSTYCLVTHPELPVHYPPGPGPGAAPTHHLGGARGPILVRRLLVRHRARAGRGGGLGGLQGTASEPPRAGAKHPSLLLRGAERGATCVQAHTHTHTHTHVETG